MATKSPLKKVNTRTVQWPCEDGSTDSRPVTLWLDPRGDTSFVIKLPDYVSKNLGVAEIVSASTADLAWKHFGDVSRKYVEWVRTAKAEPVIILRVQYLGAGEDGSTIEEDSFFFKNSSAAWEDEVCVGLRYELAFRVNGNIHYRERDRRGDDWADNAKYRVGNRHHHVDGKVIDYTPELHAKVDLICAAVSRAAQQLHRLLQAKDLAKVLLTTNFGALPAPKEKQ